MKGKEAKKQLQKALKKKEKVQAAAVIDVINIV